MSGRRAAVVTGLAAAVAALLVTGLIATQVVVERSWAARAEPRAAPAASRSVADRVQQVVPTGPPPALVATLSAAVSYSSTPGGPAAGALPAKNPFGGPEVLAVTAEAGAGPSEWLHVELPIRPNGSTGWIRAAGASLTQTYYRVEVNLTARTLTVTDAGRQVLSTPVAVGQPSTPTPSDSTYLWELIRPDDPNGPYGPYIFGLAEYSDAYATFNGGDAQIGIHGQDEPWSIGHAASNGCVRLPNAVIAELAGMLPLGTPVTIS